MSIHSLTSWNKEYPPGFEWALLAGIDTDGDWRRSKAESGCGSLTSTTLSDGTTAASRRGEIPALDVLTSSKIGATTVVIGSLDKQNI